MAIEYEILSSDGKIAGLLPTQYDEAMNSRYYALGILANTTSTAHYSKIKGGHKGMEVVVPGVPEVTVRDLVVGRPRELTEDNEDRSFRLKIDEGFEWTTFLNEIKQRYSQDPQLVQKITRQAVAQVSAMVEARCFSKFASYVPTWNCGAAAGKKTGNMDLGTAAKPVILSKSNAADFLAQLPSVISQTNIPRESGKLTLVVPPNVAYIIRTDNDLRDASKIGGVSSLKTWKIPTVLECDIYETTLLDAVPCTTDGGYAWPILAYTKEALAFCMDFNHTNAKEPDRVRGLEIYGECIFGCGAVRKDGLAIGYVRTQNTAFTHPGD